MQRPHPFKASIYGRRPTSTMDTALAGPSSPTVLLYAGSFILVMWTVVDVAGLSAKSCVDYWFGHPLVGRRRARGAPETLNQRSSSSRMRSTIGRSARATFVGLWPFWVRWPASKMMI